MSGKPAARLTDMILCTMPQVLPVPTPPPHAPPPGLPIVGIGAALVHIGGMPAARVADFSLCLSPVPMPNPIAAGAFPVLIMGMPAARMGDMGTHPGSSVQPPCFPTVSIGLSGTTGNPAAGAAACAAMPAGRNPPAGTTDPAGNSLPANSPLQSYNNCGIESSRQLIQQRLGTNPGQEALMNRALQSGNATSATLGSRVGQTTVTAANQRFFSGGTFARGQANILSGSGVPARTIPAPRGGLRVKDLQLSLSQGKGVIANGDVSGLPGWGNARGGHAVAVTGIEYDDDGKITKVHYNDTSMGCGRTATENQFNAFLGNSARLRRRRGWPPFDATVTRKAIWW